MVQVVVVVVLHCRAHQTQVLVVVVVACQYHPVVVVVLPWLVELVEEVVVR